MDSISLDLIGASFISLIVCFILIRIYFSTITAALLSLIKVCIPTAYFILFEDFFTPYDGVNFQVRAARLLMEGHNPFSLLITWGYMIEVFDTIHVIPIWWTAVSQFLFGPHYFSPIFLNLIITVITGIYLMFILAYLGFQKKYYKQFFIFYNIHWDVITFTSILNFKGVIIALLIVTYLYAFLRLINSHELPHIFYYGSLCALTILLIYWTRFYVIFILLIPTGIWILSQYNLKKNVLLGLPSLPIMIPILQRGLRHSDRLSDLAFYDLVFNFARFILTPRPWGIVEGFNFMLISSTLHWLFIIPTALGSIYFFRNTGYNNLILFILFSFIMFYTFFPSLGAVRMRYQIVFIIALFQFHFLWNLQEKINIRFF